MSSEILPMSSMSQTIVRQIDEAHLVLIKGDDRIHQFAADVATRAACAGGTVHYVSGDNRFDPYWIAQSARIAEHDDEAILQSIFIVRAFTAYQMHELVLRIEQIPPNRLVIIANPCTMFFDDDVELPDAARYFYRM